MTMSVDDGQRAKVLVQRRLFIASCSSSIRAGPAMDPSHSERYNDSVNIAQHHQAMLLLYDELLMLHGLYTAPCSPRVAPRNGHKQCTQPSWYGAPAASHI